MNASTGTKSGRGKEACVNEAGPGGEPWSYKIRQLRFPFPGRCLNLLSIPLSNCLAAKLYLDSYQAAEIREVDFHNLLLDW